MHLHRFSLTRFLGVALLSASSTVFAWDGSNNGTIAQIEITEGGNYGLRIFLTGNPAMCGNTNTWAYLEPTDSNYNGYLAVLLMAKVQATPVSIYTTRNAYGYCHISDISIS